MAGVAFDTGLAVSLGPLHRDASHLVPHLAGFVASPLSSTSPDSTMQHVSSISERERNMNTYQPDVPKAAFAASAVALTVLTLSAFVLAPAVFGGSYEPALTLAAAPTPIEVTIEPARIDVIAQRAPNVAWAMPTDGKPNCKPEV